METKFCPRCKLTKPVSEFGQRNGAKKYQHYCKPCHAEYNSQWYKNNGERAAANHRAVYRRTTLTTSDRVIRGLHKRPYTNYCEICKVWREKGLHYHHWDDHNPSRGIWVCAYCHRLLEFHENGLIDWYLSRYSSIQQEVNKTVLADNL